MTAKFPQRQLGKNGPLVSEIGLGCMGMSAFYGKPKPEEESLRVLNKALDLGCNFLDTADIYGENEELLAKLLAKRRADVFLCTKHSIVFDEADVPKYADQVWTPCGKREYVKFACERSLKRLGTSYIDLYYQHRVDPKVPIEETVGAMAELVKEKKVKYLGLSECSGETLRRAYKIHPIAAVQVEYSPWTTDIEDNGLLGAAKELGVSIVAYSPLGRGFLTGKYKTASDFEDSDWRRTNPRFMGENFGKNLEIVKKFEEIAEELQVTVGQVALAWILKQGPEFIPIPGTTNSSRLEENLGAAKIVLSDAHNARIRKIISEITVVGDRYPDMRGLNI